MGIIGKTGLLLGSSRLGYKFLIEMGFSEGTYHSVCFLNVYCLHVFL